MFFEDNIDDAKYCGHLYGLGASYVQNGSGNYDNHPGYGPSSTPTSNGDSPSSSTPVATTTSSWHRQRKLK